MTGLTVRDIPTVRILGTHGVPANYGGFETAAENVAKYLVANGWRVVVYCQELGDGDSYIDVWEGIERVHIPVIQGGWIGTSRFDLASIRHAVAHRDICLTFGYNTAIFNLLQWIKRIPNVINMDGIEWSRKRWGLPRQAILYVNERIAASIATKLIADHPELEKHLATRARRSKITMITYGAHPITDADEAVLSRYQLKKDSYFTLIARPIPENSILEIVQGFSAKRRGVKLVVLGTYLDNDDFHQAVLAAASDEVLFLGGIYDPHEVQSLRYFSRGYLHGHTVGGTNPSLVEALAAGNPVIAHRNKYNAWVAGTGALFFSTAAEVSDRLDSLLAQPELAAKLAARSLERFEQEFTWSRVASQYEQLLRTCLPVRSSE